MSVKTPQPQPAQFRYPISALQEFPVLSRPAAPAPDSYPPFDASREIQLWCDDNADGTPYNIWNSNTNTMDKVSVPSAKTPNIPGGHALAYTVVPTPATQGGSALNPFLLSTKPQADALAALVVGAVVVEDPNNVSYNGEARKVWNILTNYRTPDGQQPVNNVGLMLQQSAQPGHWGPAALMRGQYVYVASPSGGTPYGALTIDIPCRDFFPDESVVAIPGPFGLTEYMVQRSDIADPNPPIGGGGGVPAATLTQIAQTANMVSGIYDLVQRIAAAMKA